MDILLLFQCLKSNESRTYNSPQEYDFINANLKHYQEKVDKLKQTDKLREKYNAQIIIFENNACHQYGEHAKVRDYINIVKIWFELLDDLAFEFKEHIQNKKTKDFFERRDLITLVLSILCRDGAHMPNFQPSHFPLSSQELSAAKTVLDIPESQKKYTILLKSLLNKVLTMANNKNLYTPIISYYGYDEDKNYILDCLNSSRFIMYKRMETQNDSFSDITINIPYTVDLNTPKHANFIKMGIMNTYGPGNLIYSFSEKIFDALIWHGLGNAGALKGSLVLELLIEGDSRARIELDRLLILSGIDIQGIKDKDLSKFLDENNKIDVEDIIEKMNTYFEMQYTKYHNRRCEGYALFDAVVRALKDNIKNKKTVLKDYRKEVLIFLRKKEDEIIRLDYRDILISKASLIQITQSLANHVDSIWHTELWLQERLIQLYFYLNCETYIRERTKIHENKKLYLLREALPNHVEMPIVLLKLIVSYNSLNYPSVENERIIRAPGLFNQFKWPDILRKEYSVDTNKQIKDAVNKDWDTSQPNSTSCVIS